LILKGKIIKVVEVKNSRLIILKVTTYYKGILESDTATITTPAEGGMCGIIASVGEEWLFFAYGEKYGYKTNLCTRSKNMNPKAWDYNEEELKQDLEFLEDKLKNPTPFIPPLIRTKIPNRQPVVKEKK